MGHQEVYYVFSEAWTSSISTTWAASALKSTAGECSGKAPFLKAQAVSDLGGIRKPPLHVAQCRHSRLAPGDAISVRRAGDVIDALSISASHSYWAESPVRTRGIPRASNSSITKVRSMTEPSPQIEATLCASMNQRALSMPREISVKMSEVS